MGICRGSRGRLIEVLALLVPLVMIIPVPLYNRVAPELLGIPFFYWYQLAWLVVLSLSIGTAAIVSECGGRKG
ncbi:MAG: DUF3311 domain-containing protein [Acidilobus sp.]